MSLIDSVIQFLACPDDQSPLKKLNNELICSHCNHSFKILDENIVELLPSKPFDIEVKNDTTKAYEEYYSDLKNIGHSKDDDKRLWHAPKGFVNSHRSEILHLLEGEIISEIGAGIGLYSIPMAKFAKFVFHCDLDQEAIFAAQQEAKKQNISNILFIISNYFSLPFKPNSIPTITCLDVLLRGHEHDKKVLHEITSKIKTSGNIILDFHAKERSKINKNLDLDGCYSKNEIHSFLLEFRLISENIIGVGFAPTFENIPSSFYYIIDKFCKFFFPPARWIIKVHKNNK